MSNLIPFPLKSRRRKIETAARTLLDRKTQDGRDRYWRRTVEQLTGELRRHGCDDAEVRRQIDGFFAAVQAEMNHPQHHQNFGQEA